MLEFTFSREDAIDEKGAGWAERRIVIKKSRWKYKNFHLIILDGGY